MFSKRDFFNVITLPWLLFVAVVAALFFPNSRAYGMTTDVQQEHRAEQGITTPNKIAPETDENGFFNKTKDQLIEDLLFVEKELASLEAACKKMVLKNALIFSVTAIKTYVKQKEAILLALKTLHNYDGKQFLFIEKLKDITLSVIKYGLICFFILVIAAIVIASALYVAAATYKPGDKEIETSASIFNFDVFSKSNIRPFMCFIKDTCIGIFK